MFWPINDGTHCARVEKKSYILNMQKEFIAVKSSTHTQTHTRDISSPFTGFVLWRKLPLLNESHWCRILKSGAQGDSCWAGEKKKKLSPSSSRSVDVERIWEESWSKFCSSLKGGTWQAADWTTWLYIFIPWRSVVFHTRSDICDPALSLISVPAMSAVDPEIKLSCVPGVPTSELPKCH